MIEHHEQHESFEKSMADPNFDPPVEPTLLGVGGIKLKIGWLTTSDVWRSGKSFTFATLWGSSGWRCEICTTPLLGALFYFLLPTFFSTRTGCTARQIAVPSDPLQESAFCESCWYLTIDQLGEFWGHKTILVSEIGYTVIKKTANNSKTVWDRKRLL